MAHRSLVSRTRAVRSERRRSAKNDDFLTCGLAYADRDAPVRLQRSQDRALSRLRLLLKLTARGGSGGRR
jgi:hypothetical protein